MKEKRKNRPFDIPGAQFGVLATAILAEIVSKFPKRERISLVPMLFKAILVGQHRWATGTIKEGPNLTELLGGKGIFNKEGLTAMVHELGGREAAEMFAKITEIFA